MIHNRGPKNNPLFHRDDAGDKGFMGERSPRHIPPTRRTSITLLNAPLRIINSHPKDPRGYLVSMITARMKWILLIAGLAAVSVAVYSLTTLMSAPPNLSDWSSRYRIFLTPTLFVGTHLALIVMGLTLRPRPWLRGLCLLTLLGDTLLAGLATIGLLSSIGSVGFEAGLGQSIAQMVLAAVVILGGTLLLTYQFCLRKAARSPAASKAG